MIENIDKALHGAQNKRSLLELLVQLERTEKFKHCFIDYRLGYPGFDHDQFYFPFCIEFSTGKKWILSSTTSIRNDRLNIQQWNSLHIKRIDMKVEKSYIIVPDEITANSKEYAEVTRMNEKIVNGRIYSAIDEVLTIKGFIAKVEEQNIANG